MAMKDPEEQVFTVSEITELLRITIEGQFSGIAVKGEISNFRPSSTGHYYFSLKDADSVLQAVMFRNRIPSLTFIPQDGQLVCVRGSLSVYAKKGTYQIICEHMEKAGEGDILAMIEERKRRLAATGIFNPERKRPIPLMPERVAVITSPTGAAIQDILTVVRRRNSGVDLVILPAPVQGEGAAARIKKQLERANRYRMADVIIIARGGGSLEDLLPFSDEELVKAVAASEIPVISAVGHEIDTTLCDLAADLRAPTPSAAAELVSARREDLLQRVRECEESLRTTMEKRIEMVKILLKQFKPEELERDFRVIVEPYFLRLDDCKEDMLRAMGERVKDLRHRLTLLTSELEAYSPMTILSKGYAIVEKTDSGALIQKPTDAAVGDGITVRFHRGKLDASVTEIHP